jgi:hypothetical protein
VIDSAVPAPRPPTWAQSLSAGAVFVLAGAAAVIGIMWLPIWFLAAELLRLWAPRGGMRWLASRGVPEYTDDRYAAVIGIAPIAVIALRIAVSLDWLAPFRIFAGGQADITASELAVAQALVLGLVLATSLAGVLRTTGWPRILALAGFFVVAGLVVAAEAGWWQPDALAALPLLVPAYLVSRLAMLADRWLYRRAARRYGQPSIEDSGRWERT